MQYVKLVVVAYFRHLDGERQGIIGVLEQIVIVDDHRMEMQAGRVHRQTERTLVADEMHLVTALRQLLAQSSGENAAPAHGWVTGDADFQWMTGRHGILWRYF